VKRVMKEQSVPRDIDWEEDEWTLAGGARVKRLREIIYYDELEI